MSLYHKTKWAARLTSRLALDVTSWALRKIELVSEGHVCSQLYEHTKDAATMSSIFNDMDLSENKDHIHYKNDTV